MEIIDFDIFPDETHNRSRYSWRNYVEICILQLMDSYSFRITDLNEEDICRTNLDDQIEP